MSNIDRTKTLSLKKTSVVKVTSLFLMALSTVVLIVLSTPSYAVLDEMEVGELVNELGYTSATAVNRISTFRIDGFNNVNEESVIINGGPNHRYLVTTQNYCIGLEYALKIGTTSRIRDVTRRDNIVVSNGFTGREYCPIHAIYKLEGKIDKANS